MAAKNKDALKLEAMKALRTAIEADDYEALKKAVEDGRKNEAPAPTLAKAEARLKELEAKKGSGGTSVDAKKAEEEKKKKEEEAKKLATPVKSTEGSYSKTVTSTPSSTAKSPTKAEALANVRKAMQGTDLPALEKAVADLTLVDPTSSVMSSAKQKLVDLQKMEQQRASRAESEKAAEEQRAKVRAEREKEEAAFAAQRQATPTTTPLKEDPDTAKKDAERKAKLEELKKARGLTSSGAGSAGLDEKRRKIEEMKAQTEALKQKKS